MGIDLRRVVVATFGVIPADGDAYHPNRDRGQAGNAQCRRAICGTRGLSVCSGLVIWIWRCAHQPRCADVIGCARWQRLGIGAAGGHCIDGDPLLAFERDDVARTFGGQWVAWCLCHQLTMIADGECVVAGLFEF